MLIKQHVVLNDICHAKLKISFLKPSPLIQLHICMENMGKCESFTPD